MYRRSLIGSAALAGLLPGAARAQSFPSKQLRLLVGFAAGGGGDIVARILAHRPTATPSCWPMSASWRSIPTP